MILIELEKPSAEPVTVTELKAFARIERGDEDGLIARLLTAAREAVEHETGMVLARRAFRLVLDAVPLDGIVAAGRRPLRTVREVRAYDAAGAERLADPALVRIEGDDRFAVALALRDAAALEIEFEAGTDAAPEGLRQAILRIAAASYETRGLVGEALQPALVPSLARALMAPFRPVRL